MVKNPTVEPFVSLTINLVVSEGTVALIDMLLPDQVAVIAVASSGAVKSAVIGLFGVTFTAFEYGPYNPDPLVYLAFTQRDAVVGVSILAGVILFKYTC